ncbi:MAG: T9SS type A sorting domain-containing protein [Chitinispirillaceae bacterium]
MKFLIPERNSVSLDVYNATGRLVESVIKDRIIEPGEHSSSILSNASNGMYVLTLRYGNRAIRKKVVLMK